MPAKTVAGLPLPKLLQLYQEEQNYLQGLGKHRDEFLTDADFTRLRYIEEQLQKQLPDPLQRMTTLELTRQGVNPNNFADPNYWRSALQEIVQATVHFLHYGEQYPKIADSSRSFLPGDAFLLWLLQQARDGATTERVTNIGFALTKAVIEGTLLGKTFTRQTAHDFGHRITVVLMGEYAQHMQILVDIFCEAQVGERLIQEITKEVHLTPIP